MIEPMTRDELNEYASQVILQNGFGVNQQTTNEGALAVVNRAASDEFQSVGIWRKEV